MPDEMGLQSAGTETISDNADQKSRKNADEISLAFSSTAPRITDAMLIANSNVRVIPTNDGPKNQEKLLPFLNDFFKHTDNFFFAIPFEGDALAPKGVFDEKIGYRFPTSEQTANYLSTLDDSSAVPVNASKAAVDTWIGKTVKSIRSNVGGNKMRKPLVRFITGKVGSGKSTFINFLDRGYSKSLAKNKVLLCIIPHDAFLPPSLTGNATQREDSFRRAEQIRLTVLRSICATLLRNKSALKAIADEMRNEKEYVGSDKDIVDAGFKKYRHDSGASPNNDDQYKFDSLNSGDLHEGTVNVLLLLVQFLRKHGFVFIVTVDGLDMLSYGSIVETAYGEFFKYLSNYIFGHANETYIIDGVCYILTLRNCTYEKFIESHKEHMGQLRRYYLVPCDFMELLDRSVSHFLINKRSLTDDFWTSINDKSVRDFWGDLYNKMLSSLGISSRDVSFHFEYDQREAMASLVSLAKFAARGQGSFDGFLSCVKDLDPHDVFEAFLLNGDSVFSNKINIRNPSYIANTGSNPRRHNILNGAGQRASLEPYGSYD